MGGYVYILASAPYGTLYIGVTSDVAHRVWEHRQGAGSAFCRKYRVHRIVRIESFDDIAAAIVREKRLKKWPRQWKINLIEADNPHWDDLYEQLNTGGYWKR
jgi:putative endonuclease